MGTVGYVPYFAYCFPVCGTDVDAFIFAFCRWVRAEAIEIRCAPCVASLLRHKFDDAFDMRRLRNVDAALVILYFPIEVRRGASHPVDRVFLRQGVVQCIDEACICRDGQEVIYADGDDEDTLFHCAGEQ